MWLLVQCGLCIINCMMGCYWCCRFSRPYDTANPKDWNFAARAENMMCYDPFMACYILVAIFIFVWNVIVGPWWIASSAIVASTREVCMDTIQYNTM